jgi:hypothetical protein
VSLALVGHVAKVPLATVSVPKALLATCAGAAKTSLAAVVMS